MAVLSRRDRRWTAVVAAASDPGSYLPPATLLAFMALSEFDTEEWGTISIVGALVGVMAVFQTSLTGVNLLLTVLLSVGLGSAACAGGLVLIDRVSTSR